MSLLDLIDRVPEPLPFSAPIPDASEVVVHTAQGGFPFRFTVARPTPGWHRLEPFGKGCARIVGPSPAPEKVDYLSALPAVRAVLATRMGQTTWLAVPYHNADAAQKGWRDGAPRLVHLVEAAVETFDVALCRALGEVLLFDEVDTRVDQGGLRTARAALDIGWPAPRGWRWQAVLDVLRARLEAEQAKQAETERLARRQSLEGRMHDMLTFGGATLQGWQERTDGGLLVTWSHEGHVYTMRFTRDLSLEVAGICLAGTDGQHTLTSIVAVMAEARRLRRPGAGGTDATDPPEEGEYDE